jgi:hypothetical protein
MPSTSGTNRPARTLLEQLIRERNQTLEEFAAYAETFAQEHGEPGTLSAGHLQRLVAGRRYDGRPLGRLRPVTIRLLERIFGVTIDELLAPPRARHEDGYGAELRERLEISRRVDSGVIDLLYEQLNAIRYLDRQLGSAVTRDEVRTKIEQVQQLLRFSISPERRSRLAALLAELCMLAGWQALDLRSAVESWQLYEQAKSAANESGSAAFQAHTAAQQAFVLIDLHKPAQAVDLVAAARTRAATTSPMLLRSWLAAAHGEALAANKQHSASLHAFHEARDLLATDTTSTDGPYVALNSIHLERWRGHALARLGTPDAVDVLSGALDRLDKSFTRAETALRVDLAVALDKAGEREESRKQAVAAAHLASIISSSRQQYRAQMLTSTT